MIDETYLTRGANDEELGHLSMIMEAMQDAVANGTEQHGHFVGYMADKNFERAFLHADRTNRRFFGALMEFRLITLEN